MGKSGGGLCLYVHILEFYNRCVADSLVGWGALKWGTWTARTDACFFTFQPDSAITSNEVKSPVATRAETETKTEIKAKTKGQKRGGRWMGVLERLEIFKLISGHLSPARLLCKVPFDQVVVAIFCVSAAVFNPDLWTSIFGFVISVMPVQTDGCPWFSLCSRLDKLLTRFSALYPDDPRVAPCPGVNVAVDVVPGV